MLLLGVDGETVGVVGVHQIGSHRVYSPRHSVRRHTIGNGVNEATNKRQTVFTEDLSVEEDLHRRREEEESYGTVGLVDGGLDLKGVAVVVDLGEGAIDNAAVLDEDAALTELGVGEGAEGGLEGEGHANEVAIVGGGTVFGNETLIAYRMERRRGEYTVGGGVGADGIGFAHDVLVPSGSGVAQLAITRLGEWRQGRTWSGSST